MGKKERLRPAQQQRQQPPRQQQRKQQGSVRLQSTQQQHLQKPHQSDVGGAAEPAAAAKQAAAEAAPGSAEGCANEHEGGDVDQFEGLAERLSAEMAASMSVDIVLARLALAHIRASDGDEGLKCLMFLADRGPLTLSVPSPSGAHG